MIAQLCRPSPDVYNFPLLFPVSPVSPPHARSHVRKISSLTQHTHHHPLDTYSYPPYAIHQPTNQSAAADRDQKADKMCIALHTRWTCDYRMTRIQRCRRYRAGHRCHLIPVYRRYTYQCALCMVAQLRAQYGLTLR